SLFGAGHPYGYPSEKESLGGLKRDDIVTYWKQQYGLDNTIMLLAGKVTPDTLRLFNEKLGNLEIKASEKRNEYQVEPQPVEKIHLTKDNSVQSAIRIGKVLFNRTNSDYPEMKVVNMILGGYFGSRLMSNIREDKGYTYGIYSSISSLQNEGYFMVSTEVDQKVREQVVEEIFNEIRQLREKLVPADELELVKNFMMGELLSSIDGPFDQLRTFKSFITNGVGMDYLQIMFEAIKGIDQKRIQELAQKYLQEEDMHEVVVG
ncbi:MAG: insulinase family protein, partial [Bacteroidetes bacterium]|nr:insulinase family protein [Bacteroidota bacterium]